MSESLIETKRRIVTIESTKKITKAMKLVSSVKFQRWKKLLDENKLYYSKMQNVMKKTASAIDTNKNNFSQYLTPFDQDRVLYVVISSTLGLCGSYNYNVFRKLDPLIKKDDEIVIIGNKGQIHYKNYQNKIYDNFISIYDDFNYDQVKTLRHFLFRIYRENKYKSISLVYTHYKNSLSFEPEIIPIAPLDIENFKSESDSNIGYPPLFEPNVIEVADLIFPHYADSLLYMKLIESELSEQASRRNAMESATDNADELLDNLKIVYNKSRQAAITQEITEVVAGSNANNN